MNIGTPAAPVKGAARCVNVIRRMGRLDAARVSPRSPQHHFLKNRKVKVS